MPDLTAENVSMFRKMREQANAEKLAQQPVPSTLTESYVDIDMRDGYKSKLKIFKPTSGIKGPLVMLIFGGGFIFGSCERMTLYSRAMVQLFGATVINISYRLAPEHIFPVAHHDAWDSFQWVCANMATLNADPTEGFVVGGVSAGANIAAVIAQQALIVKTTPPLTGINLSVPVLFSVPEDVPEKYRDLWISREQNADAPFLGKKECDTAGAMFQPDITSEWYTPYHSVKPHVGLPRCHIQACGLDPLRDDALIHEKVLRDRGVETRLDVWPGMPHTVSALPAELDFVRKTMVDTYAGFAWLLRKDVTEQEIEKVLTPPPVAT